MNNDTNQPNNINLPQPITTDSPATDLGPVPIPLAAPGQPQPSQHAQAQDTDVIEPGWVHSVENLMRHNINNPRQLSTEFANLKAQYIRKRYGKELKG